MRRKLFSFVVALTICSFGLVVFGQSSTFIDNLFKFRQLTGLPTASKPQETKESQPSSKQIPESTLWNIVLSMDEKLEKEAAKLNQEGKDGTLFSAYFRRQGKLSPENEKILKNISKEYEKEIKQVNQEAQKIIDEGRKKDKNNMLGDGATNPPAPPAELTELQKRRNEVTLRYRDSFKKAIGEAASNQFSEFLTKELEDGAVEIITSEGSETSSVADAPNGTESSQTNWGISILFYDDYTPAVSGRGETYLDYYTAYYYDPYVITALDSTSYGRLNTGSDRGYANIQPAVYNHPNFLAVRGTQYCIQSDHYAVNAYGSLSPQKFADNEEINLLTENNILTTSLNVPNAPASYFLISSGPRCRVWPTEPPPCDPLNSLTNSPGTCTEPTPTPTPVPSPTVSITQPLDVVEKNNTKDITVTVTNNASGSTTFSLRTVSGTGGATFANGSTSTTINGNVMNQALTIKGVTESSQVDNITIEAKLNNSSTVSAHDEFTVATITLLVFDKFDSNYMNVDSNPGNGQGGTAGGSRIFPDKKDVADATSGTIDRALIKVIATVSPTLPNQKVYFISHDLDDPSANTAPLDANDTTGNIGNDNNGMVGSSRAGDFANPSGINCPAATTVIAGRIGCIIVSDGTATAAFKTTMQPGDNFAVAASLTDTYRDSINLNASDGSKLVDSTNKTIPVSGATNTDNVPAIRTEMLTVWRNLHIEVDSMGNATGNNATGTMASVRAVPTGTPTLSLTPDSALEPNRFENGRIDIGGRSLTVIDYVPGSGINANTTDTVTVINPTSFGIRVNQTFTLYDDDDFNDNDGTTTRPLHGDEGEDIPMPDKGRLTQNSDDANLNVLVPAYVRPIYDVGDNNDSVPFLANVQNQDIINLFGSYFSQQLTHNNTEFWTVYSLGGYQYTVERDGDPRAFFPNGSIQTVYGISDVPERARTGQGLVLFTEEGRDTEYPTGSTDPPISRAYTVAHEVGHLFGCIHADGGLMSETAVRTSGVFTPVCLNQIRTAPNP